MRGARPRTGYTAFGASPLLSVRGRATWSRRGVEPSRRGAPQVQQPHTYGRHGDGRGQCQMGVRGLTGYVNKKLRGAAPLEELGKVCESDLSRGIVVVVV